MEITVIKKHIQITASIKSTFEAVLCFLCRIRPITVSITASNIGMTITAIIEPITAKIPAIRNGAKINPTKPIVGFLSYYYDFCAEG